MDGPAPGEAQAWAKAAAERGRPDLGDPRASSPDALPGTAEEARLAQVVGALKDNPGLGLWKGADEPWPRFPPSALAHAFGTVKALDPNHVFHTIFGPHSIDGTVLGSPNLADLRPYNAVTDTHGTNVYPVYAVHLRRDRTPKLHMVGLRSPPCGGQPVATRSR